MSEPGPGVTRRLFIGTAAAGVATAAATAAVPALTAGATPADAVDQDEDTSVELDQPVVARVTDLSTGEVSLYVGTEEITVTDRVLARRLARAARH